MAKTKTKTKKKATVAEIQRQLWEHILSCDGELGDAFSSWSTEVKAIEKSIKDRLKGVTTTIPMFKDATLEDINKMISDVEHSCLSKACIKSALESLNAARKTIINTLSVEGEKPKKGKKK